MLSSISGTSLVGTWKLLSREDVTADGQKKSEPKLGSDPVSYLMYDASGHFSVQFMRRDRPVGASDGYDAYFGRYSVKDGVVTQELEGALSVDDVGKVVTRNFRIDGSELVISLDVTASDGTSAIRTLRWQKVA
jgi:Lipocalin-like domain